MNEEKFIKTVCKWFKCDEKKAKEMIEKSRIFYESDDEQVKS